MNICLRCDEPLKSSKYKLCYECNQEHKKATQKQNNVSDDLWTKIPVGVQIAGLLVIVGIIFPKMQSLATIGAIIIGITYSIIYYTTTKDLNKTSNTK